MSASNPFSGTPLRDILYDPTADRRAAEEGLQAGMESWRNLSPSDFQQMMMEGPLSAANVDVNPIEAAKMQLNPQLEQSQLAQLAALEDLRKSGGLTAKDRANLATIESDINRNERGQREAILQNAQMRGAATGGNALMAQLMAQQGSADRQSAAGMNIAGQAQDRAMQAGQGAGQLAGQMRGQTLGEQQAMTNAQNAINQFNAQQSLDAQRFNMGRQQGVFNQAAEAANQNQLYNRYIMPNTNFSQGAQIAGGISNAGQNAANYYQGNERMGRQGQQDAWSGAVKLGTAMLAHGGRVDSLNNDSVPAMLSPGEVVVPRSIASSDGKTIARYVQDAPSISDPDAERAAKLEALRKMGR